MTRTVSVVTPWRNHPELLDTYRTTMRSVMEVVIVDDSTNQMPPYPDDYIVIDYMHDGSGWAYSSACNQGLAVACGDIIVCTNNDVQGFHEWADVAAHNVEDGVLYGGHVYRRHIGDGVSHEYPDGWCVAATRATWDRLGGWNDEYRGAYYEDTELGLRAQMLGISVETAPWTLRHFRSVTANSEPRAHDHTDANRLRYEAAAEQYARGVSSHDA